MRPVGRALVKVPCQPPPAVCAILSAPSFRRLPFGALFSVPYFRRLVVSQSPLHKRLAMLASEVLAPRRSEAAVGAERLRVRAKDCFRLKHVPYLLHKFVPKLTHRARGLVFLDSEAPFAPGTTEAALDWLRTSQGGAQDGAQDGTQDGAQDGQVSEAELLEIAEAHFK